MANKIDVRKVLQLKEKGLSANVIEKDYHISKRSTKKVMNRKEELNFDALKLVDYNDDDLYKLFFPENCLDNLYKSVDYDYIQKELSKNGVTLKLLWDEYCQNIQAGEYPVSYSTFCRDYNNYILKHDYTNRIIHKPGERCEVDWGGTKMFFTDADTSETHTVYLFVATLPFSQYTYVEPTLDMKMETWINCNVHMFEYFGGSTVRVICDNLKTGVISHPKDGEIILTKDYEQFGSYYLCAIMPAQVRKPKQKPSVEGSVGKIATAIIAKLRNQDFQSIIQIKQAVAKALEEFNAAEFQKREGSRKLVFESEEKEYLKKLPEAPFELAVWTYGRKVNLNCHIQFKKNYYSVPYQYVKKSVDVKVSRNTLAIYFGNKRVTTHTLFPEYVTNKYSTHPEDMPESVKVTEWDDVRIMNWAKSIGPYTSIVIDRIFERCQIKEQGYNSSLSVLGLSKKYGNDRLESACGIALRSYHSPRYKHLNVILSNKQDLIEKKEHDLKQEKARQNKGAHLRGASYYGGNNNDR